MLKEGTKGKEREKKRRRKRERNRKDKGKHQAERFVMPESEREEWEEGAPVTSMGWVPPRAPGDVNEPFVLHRNYPGSASRQFSLGL